MDLEITKIENGLNWNGEDRFFTNRHYESGYQISDEINLTIELDGQIYGMCVETAILDRRRYRTSQEFAIGIGFLGASSDNILLFDAESLVESLVEPFGDLSDEQLNSLIEVLENLNTPGSKP